MHLARWQLLALLLVLGAAFCFAADPVAVTVTNQKQINSSDILAEYDGGTITRADLEAKIDKIPPNAQGRYRTVEGQVQVLDIMAVEDAFYAKALQLGLDKDPDIMAKIESGTKQFYMQEYYKRNVSDLVVVTEADKKKYYEDNKQAFYLFPYISISYIQATDEASALQAKADLQSGKPFAEVSDQYNVNTYAKGLKGVIKNIRLNGNVPGVGNDLDLEKYIAESKADSTVVLGPFKTATGWHIFRTNEYVPGRQKSYDEVAAELEQRTRPGVETRTLNALVDGLKLKYSVVSDTSRVAEIDLQDRSKNSEIEDISLVTSTSPEINITVRTLLDSYAKLSQQEQLFYSKGEGAKQLLDQELIRALIYADAKEQNYGQYLTENAEYIQMKRYYILNKVFRQLVVDTIVVSTDESKAYYDAHIADYSTPANRSIQVLWFDSKEKAERILQMYARYATLEDETRIDDLIKNNSTKPNLSTLDNIYKNGIITGIGPDEDFNKMVWENPVGYISPVFTSAKGDTLFFRIMKENVPTLKSFTETEPQIYGVLKNQKQTSQQDKVTQDLFAEFHMVKYPERLKLELSAEDLFNQADNSAKQRNFNDAITFYDQIIKNYPNGSDDYRASFMKAFIVAEELKNEELALQLFQDFLTKYPTGDLNESAQFMIDSLQGKNPLDIEE